MEEEVRFFEVDLKPFPLDALSPNLKMFVEAVAANVQVSPDMVAVPLLATLCVPLQNRFVVRIDSSYTEPLCLYTMTIARPSERKSAIMSILERPLWNFQEKANRAEEEMEQGRPPWQKTPPSERKPMTLYVTDATPEKMARLMQENDGAIAILSDEPDALAVAAGLRYGKSRNLGLMLQAWSAGHVMIQRATEDKRIIIDRAVMSVAVMSQPSFVESLIKDAEMSNRGFMQRFLYAKPLSKVGNRSFFKPEIPQEFLEMYDSLITEILKLSPKEPLRELRLSNGAKNAADLYFRKIEAEIGEVPALEGWMGKIFGQYLRIAGVLHCAIYQDEIATAAEKEIAWQVMNMAQNITDYFISHAKAVFSDIDVSEDVLFAREIYRKLVAAEVETFTKTGLHNILKNHAPKELLKAALALLVKAGYLGLIAKGDSVEDKIDAKGAEFTVLSVRDKKMEESGN